MAGIWVLAAIWAGTGAGLAQDWQQPGNWDAVGTVRQWREVDARFYRSQADAIYLDESFFNLNQTKEYQKTFIYRGRLAGISLAAWQQLDPDDQKKRRSEARRELKYVVDFRNRILTQAHNLRANNSTDWGGRIGDRTVVGDLLSRLRTATSLDPSNPYVWHLYGYVAQLVGDGQRARQAWAGAEQALDLVPADRLQPLRADVALDQAWLQRDDGEFEAALASLEIVAANGGKGLEARLLQGLLAAQMGDDQEAITIANELRSTMISIFPPDLRGRGFAPELASIETWQKRRSSYLSDWILAYTWLRVGRVDMARSVLGPHQLDAQRFLASRFWNEAGLIYEATGRSNMAAQAWAQARVALPYYPYMVYKSGSVNLARLTGRGGRIPYLLGFDSNFLSGSRLAYGADLVAALAAATDETEKEKLATRALDQLEICQRFGVNAGQASVLQGEVYYLMNDLGSALIEVQEALAQMDALGDQAGISAVLNSLSRARGEIAASDIANFYGQSGTSEGRWQMDSDPVATEVSLRQAYDAAPTDDNRRALARFLIRNGETTVGRELAAAPLRGAAPTIENIGQLKAADVALVLEADRAAADPTLAVAMVAALQAGVEDPWQTGNVWTLAGFVCLDNDLTVEGRVALERAIALDPGNYGLQVQLSLM